MKHRVIHYRTDGSVVSGDDKLIIEETPEEFMIYKYGTINSPHYRTLYSNDTVDIYLEYAVDNRLWFITVFEVVNEKS